MIDVMGGEHSLEFATFRELTVRGFRAAQSLLPKIQLLVQMALEAHGGSFPCFSGGAAAVMDGLQQVSTPTRTPNHAPRHSPVSLLARSVPVFNMHLA